MWMLATTTVTKNIRKKFQILSLPKKKKHKINEIEYIKKEKFDYNHHKSLYKIQKQYS